MDLRERPWIPLVGLLTYFAHLTVMSVIGLASLNLIHVFWLKLAWVILIGALAFGVPIVVLRQIARNLSSKDD